MQIVLIADTHNYTPADFQIPEGDFLIHCGDATGVGTIGEVGKFLTWFGKQPHRNKIFVAGNHDFLFEKQPGLAAQMCKDNGVIYLEDRGTIVEGLHIYGTPWQPRFLDWAFNLDEQDLMEKFQHIPGGLDILVTHCPPYRIMDETNHDFKTHYIGSRDLAEIVEKQKPKVHVFGHCHGGYGVKQIGRTKFINAATCNPHYKPVNPAICIELP